MILFEVYPQNVVAYCVHVKLLGSEVVEQPHFVI